MLLSIHGIDVAFWARFHRAGIDKRRDLYESKANKRRICLAPAMPSSAALRQQIENAFQHRYPSALTPQARTIRETAPTGIAEVDALLSGGLPVGAITEIAGPASSGRTSIAMAFLAQQTRESFCAWIDARDAFDPESAAASGISLRRMLWVRCSNNAREQPANPMRKAGYGKSQPWTRLDQALRATDLLLQAGGFAAIVLDLGEESPEHGRRIPLATWFRFRQAADRTRSSVIVLGKTSYAQSSAAVVLECERSAVRPIRQTERYSKHSASARAEKENDSLRSQALIALIEYLLSQRGRQKLPGMPRDVRDVRGGSCFALCRGSCGGVPCPGDPAPAGLICNRERLSCWMALPPQERVCALNHAARKRGIVPGMTRLEVEELDGVTHPLTALSIRNALPGRCFWSACRSFSTD